MASDAAGGRGYGYVVIPNAGWLADPRPHLWSRQALGNTCLSALRASLCRVNFQSAPTAWASASTWSMMAKATICGISIESLGEGQKSKARLVGVGLITSWL